MSKTMTKRKIANAVAERIGITQSEAFKSGESEDSSTISDILGNDGHIELRGFGVFEIVTQRPRVGRNPNDPDVRVHIPARKVVKFRAGTELAEKVRKLKVD